MSLTSSAITYIIKPRKGWASLNLDELLHYHELLYFLAWRNIKVRYKQTIIGAAWAIIQPLLTMIVFSVFFGALVHVPSDGIPYPIFAYAALIPWTFFSNVIRYSGTSVIDDEKLITKAYFPRLLIPASVVGVELIDAGIASCILFAMMAWYHVIPGQGIFLVPLLLLLLVMAALGVGLVLSALTVMYRDFRYLVPFMIQLWLYISPVVYPASIIPDRWRFVAALNPMTGIIEGFRSSLLHRAIDWQLLGISGIVAVTLFFTGIFYFKRLERRFADLI